MTTTSTSQSTPVTVLGLGAMGAAIARTFLERGHPTTVWNRSDHRIRPLVDAGATAAPTAAAAVAASPLTVLCVLDYEAVDDVLAAVGEAVAGRTLVNLTSGSPGRARGVQQWADERGAAYLDGGVMGDPPEVGAGTVPIPLGGSATAYATYADVLGALGPVRYHGADAGAASVEFMAQVAVGYELLIGFLHTLRLVQAEGLDVAEFAARVAATIADYPPLITALGEAVRDEVYPPDLGPLAVQSALMADLVDHRRSMGVDTVRMREVQELMARRVADGYGDEGFSSLFALLGDCD